ncbi:MAG TPA: protein kinase [Vicinamibacterales bacterium]|nr:protein kinase [Vicinamibacterales bacterium]
MMGQVIGSYQVLEKLGEGGMGQVYRARDLKLQRDVALKVLPDAFARDSGRRARFEREAHVLAALNHPQIAAIYGVAENQGVSALVLELVEGPTLEERLADGALPLEEAAAIARQVAEALEAAHEAGIVHRDLKPANIKLRPDGAVKVLDFGLAKAIEGHSAIAAERSHLPTAVADATAAGLILGTAAYMAPEQARGRTVDKRADIWAFGVVLWEMLTGRPLFHGETLTDTLAAVLTRDIDWSLLPGSTPPALVDLLRRCLERDPKKRLRDIGDVRLDASALAPVSAVGPASATARRWWVWGLAIAAALAAGVAIGRIGPGVETGPPAREVRFTFPADNPSFAAISPDGSMAVVASGGPLRVRDLAGLSLRELSGTDGAVKPFWSPDSGTIGFGRAGRLWRVSTAGGAPVVICDLPGSNWDQDAGGAWLPDDTIVFTTGGSPLMRVPAAGGDPVRHLAADAAGDLHFHFAHALPGARGLLYVVHRDSGPDTLEVFAGGTRKILLQAPGQIIRDPVYSATGHILFSRAPVNEGVWALPFSLDRLEANGTAYLVEAGLGTPSVSTTGTFLYLPAATTVPTRLQWLARDGTRLEAIGEAAQFDVFPELSPDGTQVAVGERVSGTWGLSVIDLARGTRVRLAAGERISTPAWAPDGRSILYSTTPPGTAEPVIRRVWLDGSPSESLEPGFRPVSRDGLRYFFDRFRNNDFDLLVGTLDRTAPVTAFVGGALADVAARPSPDGRLVAYMSMPSITVGNPEVVLRRDPGTGARWQVSSGGGSHPRWSHEGDRVYYITADGIYEVAVTTSGQTLKLSPPRRLFARRAPLTEIGPDGFDVARDGRFLLLEQVASSTERFVQVVLNWTPRRVPGT